jgi:hypothetical protein
MIPAEPNLPQLPTNLRGTYHDDLNWKLTQLLRQVIADVNKSTGSTWNGPHPILGGNHLWVDATGDLRIKSSAPTSDLDGSVVGAQS